MTRPEVSTTAGALLGERTADGRIAVFRGIPFAAAPTGPNRFRPPQAVTPWEGVRDASTFGKASVQRTAGVLGMFGAQEGDIDEDCLFLNVWTPGCDDARRPVLVWIHGGAFRMGASSLESYDGAGLAARGDVVVVSINYRLGLLGFLAHPELGANRGLLDQVAALAWVQREIAAFGGDPGQVTIFGESAGGKSVECLLGMPAARGLFRRAIAQSTYDLPMDADASARGAEAIAASLGVTVAGLRDVPVDELVAAEAMVLGMAAGGGGGPVIDPATLPEAPVDVLERGDRADVELLIGTTLDEAALFGGFLGGAGAEELDDEAAGARIAATIAGPDAPADLGGQALAVYRKVRESLGLDATPKSLVSASSTDRMFRQHSIRVAEAQAPHAPTFMYLFTWASPNGSLGACHGIELPFVFGTFDAPLARLSGDGAEARSLGSAVQDAWLSFARDGRPQSMALPEWPTYDADRRSTMALGSSCAVEDAPMDDIRRLWSDAAAG
jgi:para-nitrobenzyl esterase